MKPLRALVVDDSSLNRRMIAAMLEELDAVGEVRLACDGAEALRAVEADAPDLITLDLEMPRLDGFEFLQLLMDRHPIPVVVVSGRSGKESVFRALELGAIDFIAKPQDEADPLESLRKQLVEKVGVIRQLSPLALRQTSTGNLDVESDAGAGSARSREPAVLKRPPSRVVVIGASTGGPKALVTLFRHLRDDVDAALVIAQHMPPRFTRTFAERLHRTGVFRVSEAKPFERLARGHAYLCPGGLCIEIVPSDRGPAVRVVRPKRETHYVPSADQLFRSAARVMGDKAIAVVLTGMGDDGAAGASMIAERGGAVLIEEPETAVVSGMPLAVQRAGIKHQSLGIWNISDRIAELTGPRRDA